LTTQANEVSKDDRIDKILNPLIKKDLLQLTLPNKPTSPKQSTHLLKNNSAMRIRIKC